MISADLICQTAAVDDGENDGKMIVGTVNSPSAAAVAAAAGRGIFGRIDHSEMQVAHCFAVTAGMNVHPAGMTGHGEKDISFVF